MAAVDLLGHQLDLNDLVVWGSSGRYAGTHVGRVYKVNEKSVRVWMFSKSGHFDTTLRRMVIGEWQRGQHTMPSDPIRINEIEGHDYPPRLDEDQLKR